MGPAVELFLLLLFGLVVVGAGLLFFTRPLWKRAARSVVETDRRQREILEQQARESTEEAECRRRAEEELQRCLKGEDVPRVPVRQPEALRQKEREKPCAEEPRAAKIQSGDHP